MASERIERALRGVVEAVSPILGEEFFLALVQQLAEALCARFAFVAELDETINGRLRVRALWDGEALGPCFEYDVKGTPCEQVMESGFAYHASGVRRLFPGDSWLEEYRIEGYLAVALYDRHGSPIGHLGVMHDAPLPNGLSCATGFKVLAARAGAEIARRRADAALQTSEARYRGLVESQDELLVRFDMAGRITFVNEACCRFYGQSCDALRAEDFRVLILRSDVDCVRTAIKRLQTPPYRTRVDARVQTPRGIRYVAWDGCGVRDESGTIVEVQVVGRDVTDRRVAEDALQSMVEKLHEREKKLRRMAERQSAVREEERKRLGFDLHDGVCQELVGITILLESVRQQLGHVPVGVEVTFDRVTRYLTGVGEHLRDLAHDLRPLQLEERGLAESLRDLVRDSSLAGPKILVRVPTPVPRLSEVVELAVYRIAQEALRNAVRHATAHIVVVTLSAIGKALRLEISDDGSGFDPSSHTATLGLLGMEERALAIDATLDVQSAVGKGSVVTLLVSTSQGGVDTSVA